MSSLIYDSCLYNVFRSNIHFDTDTFKIILVSSDYNPNKSHSKRSDIVGEVSSGNGYIQSGLVVDVSVNRDDVNNRVNIQFNGAIWANASIKANGAIYYRMSGNGARGDDLIFFVDFGQEAVSINGGFSVTPSIIRVQK